MLKKFIPNWVILFRRQFLANRKVKYGLQKRKTLKFEVHITDHCNLNCKSCSHFSPLSKEYYLDLAQFKNDCQRLALLSNGKVEDVNFLGGEPLLHSNLCEFFILQG
ncbi:MAG: 4Fe-4S cluster-binding domain-containing protein [Endomicrobium sp.]|jgi:ABC-2 type transport system ATP-binding protein|nr:4Fe-4S cluster-binding domain-containing protein [Endomicrobium sp.]